MIVVNEEENCQDYEEEACPDLCPYNDDIFGGYEVICNCSADQEAKCKADNQSGR